VVAKAVRSSVEVIGVQSEAAPAAYRSGGNISPAQLAGLWSGEPD
jgi:threonine dehydratase